MIFEVVGNPLARHDQVVGLQLIDQGLPGASLGGVGQPRRFIRRDGHRASSNPIRTSNPPRCARSARALSKRLSGVPTLSPESPLVRDNALMPFYPGAPTSAVAELSNSARIAA